MSKNGFFHNWIVKNLLLAVILALVLVAGAVILLRVVTKHNHEIIVPDFTNMSVAEASEVARMHEMRIQVTDSVYVKRMGRGDVYRQNPKAGSHVKKGRRILLTINAVTPKSVTMPNLVGYSMRQAKAELLSRGLQLGRLIYVNDIATNNVLKQIMSDKEIMPGVQVESESVIDLVVGLNPADDRTVVPSVVGSRYLNAVDAVHDRYLNIRSLNFDKTVKDYSDSLNAMVYRQSPEEEECLMGTGVTLYLTLDKNKVPAAPVQQITID